MIQSELQLKKQRVLSNWLKAVVVGMGILGAIVYGFVLPMCWQNATVNHTSLGGTAYWVRMGFLWVTAIPCYIALVYAWKVFTEIGNNNSFSFVNAKYLKNVAILAIGTAIAIIIGQLLGANKIEEAIDKDNKLIAFAIMMSVGIGLLVALIAPFFPQLYDTTEAAKEVATRLMLLQALFFPSFAFMNSAYFTMRSGGKTFITFLFDSVFVWVASVPIAFVCSRYTDMSVYMIFLLVNLADLIKIAIGAVMLKKRMWVQNIVDEK